MHVIGVLDIRDGFVVHAKGGDRSRYRPVQSVLTSSANPRHIAEAFQKLGLKRCYVADLDGIESGQISWNLLKRLLELDLEFLVDAGFQTEADLLRIFELGAIPILATETLASATQFSKLCDFCRSKGIRFVFSIDLKNGKPIPSGFVDSRTALQVLTHAIATSIDEILILDLSSVGTENGPGTDSLIRKIHVDHPNCRLIVGGGIRTREKLFELADAGVDAVLIASAIHQGTIGFDDLIALANSGSIMRRNC